MFRKYCAALLATTTLIASTGCSVVGIRTTPEPTYEVVKAEGNFELRRYPALVVASTQVNGDFESAGDKAFRPLFEYISGANQNSTKISMTAPVLAEENPQSGQKIAMTAPVIGTEIDGAWEYQFVLPDSFTLESAPQPTNPNVSLKETRPKLLAVVEYSGLWREKTKQRHQAKLSEWMEKQGLQGISNPMIAGYDPPWTLPFLRRNEILIEVKQVSN